MGPNNFLTIAFQNAVMVFITACLLLASNKNLVANPEFAFATNGQPAGYELKGAARYAVAGYNDEYAPHGVALDSSQKEGAVSQLVHVLNGGGRWVTFSFRGKAEDGFSVSGDQLFMQFDFYDKGGVNYLDSARRLIYREILKDRRDLSVNGNNGKFGAAVWRTYRFEELLPFNDADAVKVTVAFRNGNGTGNFARFFVSDFSLIQRSGSLTGRVEPSTKTHAGGEGQPDSGSLVSLGGRWYYEPAAGEHVSGGRLTVTEANANRLFYKDGRLSNPFAGNMSTWLRKGYLDAGGRVVEQERFVADNVVLRFDGSPYFTITSHGLPNHPTGKFPDTVGTQGYNPNYIGEVIRTFRLPITPKRNPNAMAMTQNNSNMGLNMGPTGIAINGVVFYNPFDAGMSDATSIMDRCCGHPSPDSSYHYHKYPICVNTPFVDKGEEHSPLIGFALDGFPIYGPYEAKDLLARDLVVNKLNAFNAHYDPERGWHYHVTPGKFPYIIGGYMGSRN